MGRTAKVGVRVTLKHIDHVKSPGGKVYYYFRAPGRRRVKLVGEPGTPAFMSSYNEALATLPACDAPKERWQPHTMAHLASLYYATPKYLAKSERTRYVERRKFDGFMKEYGHLPAKSLHTRHLDAIFAKMADRPMAAMDLRKRLRNLTVLMIKLGWRSDDPIAATDTFKGGEHHSWTEDEIEMYQDFWPIGTRQRAAFDLALFTGQRRSDLHRMTWTDIAGGTIRVTQWKTDAKLVVPLHRDLLESLRLLKREHLAIITTEFGKAFSQAGFGNWMADNIGKAGLPDRCVLHGLRKAAAARLAEAGCSANEIASITGHKTLKEIARYTAGAEQGRLARSAMAKMEGETGNTYSQIISQNTK